MGLTARDAMVTGLATLGPHATVGEAAKLMVNRQIGSVLVVDNVGRLVGILTESDFVGKKGGLPLSGRTMAYLFGDYVGIGAIQEIYDHAVIRPVNEFMTVDVETATPETPIEDVVNLMVEREVKRIPIVDDRKLVGLVARRDVLKIMLTRP